MKESLVPYSAVYSVYVLFSYLQEVAGVQCKDIDEQLLPVEPLRAGMNVKCNIITKYKNIFKILCW